MRWIALLLSLATLAGCLDASTQPPASGTTPTNSTTTSTPVLTTITTSPTPTTPTPTTPTPPYGGALVRPAHGENASAGFKLVGDESASGFMPGGSVEFVFTGTNEGSAAKVLADPCGGGNPKVFIEDANGTRLALAPPMMHCMAAVGFVDSPAGARYSANLTWNGTVYEGETGHQVADGTYDAVGTFTAQRDGATVDITVKIPVHVFRTRGMG